MVSVVIPIYNGERYLEECLESVLGQTYTDIEVITVDDGSTDGSAGILKRYAERDERVRIVTKQNGGLSSARNAGIAVARGEWLFFVDCDDTICREVIGRFVEVATTLHAEIVYGYSTFDSTKLCTPASGCKDAVMSGMECVEHLLYQDGVLTVSAWGQLFARRLFTGENLFAEGQYYEDIELIPRIYAGVERVAIVAMNVYFYRQHGESFLHRFSPRRFDSLLSVESLQRHVAPMSRELAKAVNDRMLSASFNAFLLAARRPEYKGTADRCWAEIKRLRWQSLRNPRVRIKNKAGILLSLIGRRFLTLLADHP